MNLIESIDFLDNNWDECIEDQNISKVIKNNSDILPLQEQLLNTFKQETQQIQYHQLEESINNVNDSISTILAPTNEAIDLLFRSQNQIKAITHVKDFKNSEISKAKKNIQNAKYFYSMLDSIIIKKNRKYTKGDDDNNFLLLNDLIKFRNLINDREIKNVFIKESKKLDDFINDTLESIKKDISDAFFNRKLNDSNTLNLYHEYYTYIERLTLIDNQLIKFQTLCVNSIVNGILRNIDSRNSSLFKLIAEKLQTHHFNYKDKRIKEICELTKLTPTSIPPINLNEDPLELKLIHFIINLPQTIENCIYELYQVFRKKIIANKFLETLISTYNEVLIHENIYKKSILDESIFFCFIFATISFHRITFNSPSQYYDIITNIIQTTYEYSFEQANLLYSKYFTDKNSKFNKFDEYKQKYLKLDKNKKQEIQDEFIIKYISIIKDEISPIAQCVSMFYDFKGQDRENEQNHEWYNKTIDVQGKCHWFFDYNALIQTTFLTNNINLIIREFSQTNIFFVHCMLYHYLKYSNGLSSGSLIYFYQNVFLREIKKGKKVDLEPFNQSLNNIRMEDVLDIISSYESSNSENAIKYLKLYAKVTALYIQEKSQMISKTLENFIVKCIVNKKPEVVRIYNCILDDFKTYLVNELRQVPYFLIKSDTRKQYLDQYTNDVHQALQT